MVSSSSAGKAVTWSPAHGGSWRPPWSTRVTGDPTSGVVMYAMYQLHSIGGGIGGSSKEGSYHSGTRHGGPTTGKASTLDLALVSCPRVCPLSHGHASMGDSPILRSRSSSTYFPNLNWISRACGKSVGERVGVV
jgi:hypothetical protein